VVRAASAWDSTPSKIGFGGVGSSGTGTGSSNGSGRHQARVKRRESHGGNGKGKGKGKGNENEKPKKTPKSGGAGGFFGAGDWLAAAFTPRGPLAPDPDPPLRYARVRVMCSVVRRLCFVRVAVEREREREREGVPPRQNSCVRLWHRSYRSININVRWWRLRYRC